MMAQPRQLILDLAHRPALGAEDFLVSSANAAAVDMVDRWRDWPQAAALLVGPERSGKTHLAQVWRLAARAQVISGVELNEAVVRGHPEMRCLVVEDIDQGIASEQTLFHLLNLAREHRQALLITSARPAGELTVALPDLRSRLRALPQIGIEPPDTELLRAVLVKLFADRQLVVEPHVVSHIALHMDRSIAMAAEVVAEIDRRSLAARRRVTRALASEVVARAGIRAGD